MLNDLNSQQLHAVKYCDGPLLVIAGAGSGKTKMLTTKIAYLIKELSISSNQILAMTFTNKAAKEMLERVKKILYKEGIILNHFEMPIITTFHSFAVKFLRNEIHNIGFNKSFNILDSEDSLKLIKNCMEDLKIDTKSISPKSVQSYISFFKNKMINIVDLTSQNPNSYFYKELVKIYSIYQKKLKEYNSCDFDDLILHTLEILKNFPQIAEKYRNYFKYILIDEYQDTNKPQYLIIKSLVNQGNICVVGDDDQSIYGFRGADVSNILDFEKDFPNACVIKLEQNYRSTQNILNAANSVIACNSFRREKKLWTLKSNNHKIKILDTLNEKEEAEKIAQEINYLITEKNFKYKDIAILYRINAQSRVLEEAMLKHGIPYKIIGGLKFYERKEIKDILAYLKIIFNPNDDISLQRIINVPHRGISKELLNEIMKIDIEIDIKNIDEYLINFLNKFDLNKNSLFYKIISYLHIKKNSNEKTVNTRKKAILNFLKLYDKIYEKSLNLSISDLIRYILEITEYKTKILNEEIDAESRLENIEELLTVSQKYDEKINNYKHENLEEFLTEVSLITDIDNQNFDENTITLMTVHSAKGLEFEIVFIAGAEENIFPSYLSISDPMEIEEERRLMYVAITRAKEILYISYTKIRSFMGITRSNKPSRFLEKIPTDLVEIITDAEENFCYDKNIRITKNIFDKIPINNTSFKDRFLNKNINNEITNKNQYKVGDKIYHKKFGEGIIIYISGDILKINFFDFGIKTLLASSI